MVGIPTTPRVYHGGYPSYHTPGYTMVGIHPSLLYHPGYTMVYTLPPGPAHPAAHGGRLSGNEALGSRRRFTLGESLPLCLES